MKPKRSVPFNLVHQALLKFYNLKNPSFQKITPEMYFDVFAFTFLDDRIYKTVWFENYTNMFHAR